MKTIRLLKEESHRIDEVILDKLEEEDYVAISALAYNRDHLEMHIMALEDFKKLPCVSSEKVSIPELIQAVRSTIHYYIYEYFEDHTEADFKQEYGLFFTEALKLWYSFMRRFDNED